MLEIVPNGNHVHSTTQRMKLMTMNSEQAKGKLKEAAGILTGDEKLENEGKGDKLAGDAKSAIQGVADKVEEAVDSVKQAVQKD